MQGSQATAIQPAGTKADWLKVAAGRVGGRKLYRWSMRARRDEQRAKRIRTAVVFSLFMLFLMGALLLGGRAAIDPLLQAVGDSRDARREGKIILTMPDGIYCRHVAFDNTTGAFSERTVEQCQSDISKPRSRENIGFAWRTH
jgi:hypothetical protein